MCVCVCVVALGNINSQYQYQSETDNTSITNLNSQYIESSIYYQQQLQYLHLQYNNGWVKMGKTNSPRTLQ